MIINFMYHRVYDSKDDQKFANFKKHLEQLVSKYSIVVPGEVLSDRVSICLTFDDATFDFYKYVFPLLKQYNIKAAIRLVELRNIYAAKQCSKLQCTGAESFTG